MVPWGGRARIFKYRCVISMARKNSGEISKTHRGGGVNISGNPKPFSR